MLTQLICAHLVGDFLLQNHWMQQKSKSSFVCSVHVLCYSLPFLMLFIFASIPIWALAAIFTQHWLQDRFALHTKWMAIYGQTMPDKWPVGPLCMDQAWHIGFIWLVAALAGLA